MSGSPQLKRNLLLFSYTLLFWLILVVLDVTLDFNGTIAGLFYWLSLILLFFALWYVNLPAVRNIENELLRFIGIVFLTTLIMTIFMFIGFAISRQFKVLIGGS